MSEGTDAAPSPPTQQSDAEAVIWCSVCRAPAVIAVRFRFGARPGRRWWFYCGLHDARAGLPGHELSGWQEWQLDEIADVSPD